MRGAQCGAAELGVAAELGDEIGEHRQRFAALRLGQGLHGGEPEDLRGALFARPRGQHLDRDLGIKSRDAVERVVAQAGLAFEQLALPVVPFDGAGDPVVAHRRRARHGVDHGFDFQLRVDGHREIAIAHAELAQRAEGGEKIERIDAERRGIEAARQIGAGGGEFAHGAVLRVGQQQIELRRGPAGKAIAGARDAIDRARGCGLHDERGAFARRDPGLGRPGRDDGVATAFEDLAKGNAHRNGLRAGIRKLGVQALAAIAGELGGHQSLLDRALELDRAIGRNRREPRLRWKRSLREGRGACLRGQRRRRIRRAPGQPARERDDREQRGTGHEHSVDLRLRLPESRVVVGDDLRADDDRFHGNLSTEQSSCQNGNIS